MGRRRGWMHGYDGRSRDDDDRPPPPSERSKLPRVRFVPWDCPKCRSSNVLTYGRGWGERRFIDRYHVCRDCSTRYISEQQPGEVISGDPSS